MKGAATLGGLARQIRSKNAGPFWVTIDIFLETDQDYELAAADGFLTPDLVGEMYRVRADEVRIHRLPRLRVVKVSYPRRVPQGSIHDTDMHAAQQFIPLGSLRLPAVTPAPEASDA